MVETAVIAPVAPAPHAARRALAGFFLSGLLLSFLGAILPAWGYHLRGDFREVGLYFLSLGAGLLTAQFAGRRLLSTQGAGRVLTLSAALAAVALVGLAFAGPPVAAAWRMLALGFVGLAAGSLTAAVFHCVSPMYERDAAATVNLSGILFGLGCLVTALLVAGSIYIYSQAAILFILAAAAALFALWYGRHGPGERAAVLSPTLDDRLRDFRSPSTVLLALLLFFQFGNEWSLAGWMSLFFIKRLGTSPLAGLLLLSLYWAALLLGRVAAQRLLGMFSHGRLLMSSTFATLFGFLILATTNNLFGAVISILFLGGGFAMMYPLVVEKIGHRFTYYHPGLFNGIFTIAFAGGLLAPWLTGVLANSIGIVAVAILPLIGTVMVCLLQVMIWLETRFATR